MTITPTSRRRNGAVSGSRASAVSSALPAWTSTRRRSTSTTTPTPGRRTGSPGNGITPLCDRHGGMVELIPREVLFGNPERVSPHISPDGTQLAWIAPHEGVLNVWVAPVTPAGVDWPAAKVVTDDTDRGVRVFAWARDGRHLLYLQDTGGDENWRLYDVDMETMARRDLTPFEGIQARIIATRKSHRNEVLVAMNRENPQLHDVFKLDLTTGELDKLIENPGYAGWLADEDLVVRGAISPLPDGGFDLLVRDNADADWRTLLTITADDAPASDVLAFTGDGNSLLAISSAGTDTGRLVRLDLASGDAQVLLEDPEADVAGAMLHPDTREPQIVEVLKDRTEYHVLDPAVQADWEAIQALHHGDPQPIGRDEADSTWLIAFMDDAGPTQYYAFDRATAAQPDPVGPGRQLGDEAVVQRILHDQPRAGRAHLPGVQERRGQRVVHHRVEVGAVEHDVGVLAAELERHPPHPARRRGHDLLAGSQAAGEGDQVHALVRDQRLPHRAALAEQQVQHAGRQVRLLEEPGQGHRGQRGQLAGLDHGGVARGQRGRELPGDLQQGIVPRRDQRADADRLVGDPAGHVGPPGIDHPSRVGAGHPGVVAEHRGGVVHVGPGLVQRLTGVQALGVRQLLAVPLEQVGDLGEQRGPLGHGGPAPRPVERLPGRRHGGFDVGGARLGQGVKRGRVVRVDGLRRPAVRRLRPLPRNVQMSHVGATSRSAERHYRRGGERR